MAQLWDRFRRIRAKVGENSLRLAQQERQLQQLETQSATEAVVKGEELGRQRERLAELREELAFKSSRLASRQRDAAKYADGLDAMKAGLDRIRRQMALGFASKCHHREYCLSEGHVSLAAAEPAQMRSFEPIFTPTSGAGGALLSSSRVGALAALAESSLQGALTTSARLAATMNAEDERKDAAIDEFDVIDLDDITARVRHQVAAMVTKVGGPAAAAAAEQAPNQAPWSTSELRASFDAVNELQSGLTAGPAPWLDAASLPVVMSHFNACLDGIALTWSRELTAERRPPTPTLEDADDIDIDARGRSAHPHPKFVM